ncbi:MAG: Rrf2 family transcriptional regulator [Acidobacteriota bacterium]
MPQMLHVLNAATLGIHACCLLAAAPENQRLTSQNMAEILHGSANHIAKIMQLLTRAGILHSIRGPGGGFTLACDPEKTSILEIFEVIEGPILEKHCMLRVPACNPSEPCVMGSLVQEVQDMVRKRFSETTLGDMARFLNSQILPA